MLLGPHGGDARSLAYEPGNPDHVFLGTSTGSMFSSTDGGENWSYFTHLGGGDNYVLDHIVIDPKNPSLMFVSAWDVDDYKSGDIFRSKDAGRNWVFLTGMHQKSIRALAMAASDPNVLVAGALDGLYRSLDVGESWQRISPANDAEIKNIESIAIDPKNASVIYAGTWHLAWKTTDGGVTWHHMNHGMIDDSDVFSIIVDPANSSVVFASACSGIYKSETAGESFHKVQGIPFSARRTRVLKQDPSNSGAVYAGTTQGLWKTVDAGKTWKQMTSAEIVVNDVLVDPRNSSRVLLATDRAGVMRSNNGGASVLSSNHGYVHRYVTTILGDADNLGTIFVGIANDREWGGVFSIHEGGTWQQRSTGLSGRDVFALKQASDGAIIAGTNRGVFVLDRHGSAWRPCGESRVSRRVPEHSAKTSSSQLDLAATQKLMNARVSDIEFVSGKWLAATSEGLFTSRDKGRTWNGGAVLGKREFIVARYSAGLLVAATHSEIFVSSDEGISWQLVPVGTQSTSIRSLAVTPNGEILIASREGAFRSSDSGKTWTHVLNGLPERDISYISCDESGKNLLATSLSTGVIFLSDDGGRSWSPGPDSGYPIRQVKVVRGRLLAATPFDGLVAQP